MKHIFLLSILLFFITKSRAQYFAPIQPSAIEIIRDSFGTPYIYAQTDAEVAYGLAWANAEDAFDVMQEMIISAKARFGEYKGVEGAKRDFIVKSLQLKERVDALYDTSFSTSFKKYLNGYVQGINAYAKAHPNECKLKNLFPITEKDYVVGNMFICCYMQFIHKDIQRILNGSYDKATSHTGSNFYAFSSQKTIDGSTYFCANPHQPMEGPFSWYEAHLHSQEGLNVHGCLFFGGASIAIGNTPNLGWSMTFNALDLSDVFLLTVKKTNATLYYQYNNEWYPLNEVENTLHVKIGKAILPVKKTSYTSIHGPVYRSKDGQFYAVRCGALFNIRISEQLYKMNKAENFDTWHEAISMQGLPRYNMLYSDKYGQLMYLNNGQIPLRTIGPDYTMPVDGNVGKYLWNSFIPISQLPQVKNPNCGYIFNMNNSEFNCTCASENPNSNDSIRYPKHAAYRTKENNRSERFMELVLSKQKFTYHEFKQIKYDATYPTNSLFLKSIEPLLLLDKNKYPDIAYEIEQIQQWNKTADTLSIGAALSIATFHFLFEDKEYGSETFLNGVSCTEAEWVYYIRKTKKYVIKHFGKRDVNYGTLCKQGRGICFVPTVGFPDMLEASYAKPMKKDFFEVYIGDSYLQFAHYDSTGIISCESMLPYGNSSHKENKHYSDQMQLYVSKNCKPVYFTKSLLLQNAEKVYYLP